MLTVVTLASFPGLPHFCSSVCINNNTQKQKSVKNGEGLGIHHMSGVRYSYTRWTLGWLDPIAILLVLSRKFWSSEKTGPEDQNSRYNGPAGPFSPENFGPDLE